MNGSKRIGKIAYTCHILHGVDTGFPAEVQEYCYLGYGTLYGIGLVIGDDCVIRSHSVIYGGSVIGDNFTTGHFVLIRQNCTIGDNVSIGSYTELSHDVIIGHRVRIHSHCFIPEGTHIMDDAWIGPRVCFTNDKYPGKSIPSSEKELQPVIVEHDAVIGANATILPGVTIGHHSLVGAGAVVTKDVKPFDTVVGNPARSIE